VTVVVPLRSLSAGIAAPSASAQRRRQRRRRAFRFARAALLLGCGTLAFSSAALAKRGTATNEGLVAHSYKWQVTVDGHIYSVPAGGQLKYCVTDTVEDLRLIAVLSAREGGEHRYVVRLFGPKGAGQSNFIERVVHGRRAALSLGFVPAEFPELTRTTNRAVFVAGTYRARVTSIVGRELHKHTVTLGEAERIKLAPRRGC
jgi:hypothetical protein